MAALLDVKDLSVFLGPPSEGLEPVSRISFSLAEGRTLGVVGESGCGKSMAMMAIMGLLPRSAVRTGSIMLRGEELIGKSNAEMSRIRGKRVAMIFQDPMTSLNPVLTIGQHLDEAIALHARGLSRRARRDRALELMEMVSIPFPERRLLQHPHVLSGGMRQRVMIALAMSNDPELLIADEPTTALDVTVQAQILELLLKLRARQGMSMLLISHDLGVIAEYADDVAVMYGGRVCEQGPVGQVFGRPYHPYTRGLLDSIPAVDRDQAMIPAIPGNLPSLGSRPDGCHFHPRCALAMPVCTSEDPELREVSGRSAACHFVEQRIETATGAIVL